MSLDPDRLQLNRYGRASSFDRPFQKESNFEAELTRVRSRNPFVATCRPSAIARCLAQAIGSVGLPGATAGPARFTSRVRSLDTSQFHGGNKSLSGARFDRDRLGIVRTALNRRRCTEEGSP
jgi:hypothetical protein